MSKFSKLSSSELNWRKGVWFISYLMKIIILEEIPSNQKSEKMFNQCRGNYAAYTLGECNTVSADNVQCTSDKVMERGMIPAI